MFSHLELFVDCVAGVDNWGMLHTQLVAACPDFNRSSDACRKKWKKIYDEYKADYTINGISGNARSAKCKWYSLVDGFMHDRANVMKHVHASATDEDPNNPQEIGGEVGGDRTAEKPAIISDSAPSSSQIPVGKRGEKFATQEAILEMSQHSKLLLQTMKETEDQKLALLQGMLATMSQLVNKF